MKTFVIGRSRNADISIADDSVARRHAELVVTDEERYHLTDCATESGTWVAEDAGDGTERWRQIRQSFIRTGDRLRLGAYRCTVRDLLREVADGTAEPGRQSGAPVTGREPAQGPVERDPLTGEIIRRRL